LVAGDELKLFADRLSAKTMRANQLRLTLSTLTYTLLVALRDLVPQGTELEGATPGNIRTRLLKVGAQVRVSVRRIVFALSDAFPAQDIFIRAARDLAAAMARASVS
jgi:hypothetical protein